MQSSWRRAGDVIASLLESKGLQEGVRRHTAILGWEEIVGKRIAERASPLELRGKTLFVDVNGSAWIHELSFMKADILGKLNARAGGGAIDEIVFVAADERRGSGVREPRTGRRRRDG